MNKGYRSGFLSLIRQTLSHGFRPCFFQENVQQGFSILSCAAQCLFTLSDKDRKIDRGYSSVTTLHGRFFEEGYAYRYSFRLHRHALRKGLPLRLFIGVYLKRATLIRIPLGFTGMRCKKDYRCACLSAFIRRGLRLLLVTGMKF